MFFVRERVLLSGNIRDVIATLCPGDNVAVGCQLEIGSFDSGPAQLQILCTFPEGGHFASREKPVLHDQLPVIMIDFQIKMLFFVFCGYI